MSKKIHSFWRLLLGSLITLLGFTACKTSKKVQQDDIEELYGPPTVKVDKHALDGVIALYGGPSVRVVREQKRQK